MSTLPTNGRASLPGTPCLAAIVAALLAGCGADNGPVSFLDGDGDTDAWDMPWDGADMDGTSDTSPPDVPSEGWDSEEECVQDIDVVFVIDVSTSMSFVLETLSDGIAEVWSYALTFSADPSYDPQFALVVFVDDVLVTNTGSPYGTAADLQAEFDEWRAFTSSESEPGGSAGTNNDCPENSIDALYAASTLPIWREDALHIIIFATDDTFVEYPGTLGSASLPVAHTYMQVFSSVIENEVRVAAFAAHVGVCWDSNDGEPGFFTDYGGTPALPTATGSAAFDIQDVADGTIDLTEAIKGIILDEYCTPFII